MSTKKYAIAVAAALAASVTIAGQSCEQLLDNTVGITAMKVIEVDASGSAVLFFTAGTDTKVVCDSLGAVRVYGDVSSAMAAIRRAKVGSGVAISVRKFDPVVTVGSPVAGLISSHKAAKKEKVLADANHAKIVTDKVAAEGQNWDDEVGTPLRAAYDDIVQRLATVGAWKAQIAARVTALSASLATAGISDVTYLPL
jgi:hypothetical protein